MKIQKLSSPKLNLKIWGTFVKLINCFFIRIKGGKIPNLLIAQISLDIFARPR